MSEIDPEIAETLKRHAHSVDVSPDLPERIVHRVRSRHRRRRAALVAIPAAMLLALVIAVAVVFPGESRTTTTEATTGPAAHGAASATRSPTSGGAARPVVLTPTGIGQVRFGETQTQAIGHLELVLGQPETTRPRPKDSCDITSSLAWRGFTAFFNRRHFAGYSTTRQSLATARGLHSGETVAAAKAIYGTAFHLSTAQGGSYRITLSSGELTGDVHGRVTATSIPPTAEVDGIEAGATGCPGISP
ncbi:hypothetical protein [Ferrimicrobium acidiphilum]|jgi:hypothetical protein|uniref:hypothetical protein n=1 Tax=Ferrimicrobium acidiphilum TaxID=121039 RepID=UPI0023F2DC9C|nr:hypothetical protein [Ferrimicrobium acidiphilum]